MRRTTIVLSAVVVIFAALSSHTSATDKTPASKPAPVVLKTGYRALPEGTVRIWDLGKKCTKKIKGFFHKEGGWYYRENWIQVPYGTTDYKFKGDCALEGTNFWIHLHGHNFDAIFIYPKVDDKGTPGGDNELYRSHSPAGSGLRNYGQGSNKARIVKNAPGEIAVESESLPRRGSKVTTVYRILAGKPWVKITPVRMATEQGMHGETRIAIVPEAGKNGNDFVADSIHFARHHPKTGARCDFPAKSRMMLDLMMDDDQIYVVTWPTPKKARPHIYLSQRGWHRGWDWIGEGKTRVWTAPFAYFGDETEPIIIGSLRFGYWHYQKIDAKVKAGEKFTGRWKCVRTRLGYGSYAKEIGAGYPFMKGASWRPLYPGKWRMTGAIDEKYYTREVIVKKADTTSSAFEFTSPVSGTLEYLVMYLYDRTKETPKDVYTPMDIYREAIQGKKPAAETIPADPADEAGTTNIAPNPGAEKGQAGKLPEGWGRYGNTPSDAGTTQKVRHGGKRSAYLKVTGFGGRGRAYTGLAVGKTGAIKGAGAVPVKPNTKYYFSFHIRGEGFNRGITVWPREFKADGSGVDRSIAGIEVIPKDDWLRHMGSFTTGAETERVVLTFVVHGFNRDVKSGAVFFVDDVYIGTDKADAKAGVMDWRGGAMAKGLWMEPDYLDKKIKHISDEEVFASLDLAGPGLEEVNKAVKSRDYKAAYRAWAIYWARTHQVKPPSPQKTPNKRRLERAAGIIRHEISGWGGITIKHGPVVDFNTDGYGAGGKGGFHYWGWSRSLLRAYQATGDEKYLACFDKLFNQWYEQRDDVKSPSVFSVIWNELGVGIRAETFIEFYRRPFSKRTALTHERMLKTLLGSGRWLVELEKMGYDKGNWQVTGCSGLVKIGLAVPEFAEAQGWVRTGVQRIAEHAERDFFSDGCHSERCPSSYMFGVYYGLMRLARSLEDRPVYAGMVRRIDARLERSAEFWMYMTTPEGHLSGINDGGRGVFGPGTLTQAGKLFNRKDFLFVAKNLLGGKIDGEVAPPKHTSINFPDSGFAVMRSDWTGRARYMLLNYGPDRVWHTHRDILDFEISAFGRALSIDAGLGVSYDDPLNNPWYNASRAHNMLVVDDGEIDRAVAQGRDVVWDSQSGLDFFAATTLGWDKDATVLRPGDEEVPLVKGKGVVWRRCVAFVKPDYWIIYDVARTAKAGHTLSWYFHSPTDLVAKGGGFASTKAPGLLVRPIGRTFKTRRGKGRASVRGLGFKGSYRDIDWVAFDAPSQKDGRVTFPMMLLPYEKSQPRVELRIVTESDEGAHFVIRVGEKIDHVVFSIGQKGFRDKDIQTDGHCAVVRCRDGKVVSWSVAGGKKLVFPGISTTSKDSSPKKTNEGSDKAE